MKIRILGLLLVGLFLLPCTAGATNWIYLQRLEGTRYGPCTEYLDTDSVVKKQDRLHYWTLWVMDERHPKHNIKKMLRKSEGLLGDPIQTRFVEYYQYDIEDKELFRYVNTSNTFSRETLESSGGFTVQRALQYVKGQGELFSVKPTDLGVSGPRWFGSQAFEEFDLYWDIHSISAYPLNKPDMVEIIVKWVWNEKGLAIRQAYLAAQQPRNGEAYKNIRLAVVNYRFQVDQNKMMILSISDLDENNQRLYFTEVYKWQDIEPGSSHAKAREIALKWLRGGADDTTVK